MEQIMPLMMRLKRITRWINIGTITEAILLLFNAALWFLPPVPFITTLYGESIITIGYMIVYAIIILLLYFFNKMEKDIQKAIKITVVRGLLSVILPIPLLFPLATMFGLVWILALLFFILSLIRFLLLMRIAMKLQALQKQFST